jgi:hypothetical protein
MKNLLLKFNPLPFLLLSTIFLVQCREHCDKIISTRQEAVEFLSFEELRASQITFEEAHVLKKPGKIYVKDTYLFINEINEGIHVIDNSNPSAPITLGFLKIVGNVDISIRGNTLFADSYVDLLSIDISTIRNPKVLQRVENIFENNFEINASKGIPIAWKTVEYIEENCYTPSNGIGCANNDVSLDATSPEFLFDTANKAGGTGQGGSLARFSVVSAYLYVLTFDTIEIYNLANSSQIKQESTITVGQGIETIWAHQDKLFIGSTTGMYIYDNSNPTAPSFLSKYEHVFSCDPVVVEGDLAYVTLRMSENEWACNRGFNRLEIVNISDPRNPRSVAMHGMSNPHGLGIDNGVLFICDGDAGLRVYDANNSQNLIELVHYQGINSMDVIPLGDILLMIGEDGFYQYDYSDLNNINLLSKILVE